MALLNHGVSFSISGRGSLLTQQLGMVPKRGKKDKCVLSHILLEKKTKGTQNPILLLPLFIKRGDSRGTKTAMQKGRGDGISSPESAFLLPKVPPFVKLYTLCFFS